MKVFFIDESLAIGRQKVLLLLGLNLDQNQFGRAPDFEQVRVLHLGVAPSWKASDIVPIIQRLQNQGYQFLYCPSDQGNNLVKSLKTAQIPRVSDCTHAFSKLIEKQYKNHADFQAFTQACTLMRKRLIISDYAAIMPPQQRAKARFLNLREIAKWGHQSLELLHKLRTTPELFSDQSPQQIERMKEELQWLKPMRKLIEQLFVVSQNMDQIFKILKHRGLCKQTAREVKALLRTEEIPNFWKEGVEKYVDKILSQFPDTNEPIVCCCDIIESYFGKFKLAASQNPGQGITGACLRMASFSHKTDIQTTKNALESISVNQIHQWKKEELPPNLIQLKKQINKSVTNFPTQNTA